MGVIWKAIAITVEPSYNITHLKKSTLKATKALTLYRNGLCVYNIYIIYNETKLKMKRPRVTELERFQAINYPGQLKPHLSIKRGVREHK